MIYYGLALSHGGVPSTSPIWVIHCGRHLRNGHQGGTLFSDYGSHSERTPARVLLTILTYVQPVIYI